MKQLKLITQINFLLIGMLFIFGCGNISLENMNKNQDDSPMSCAMDAKLCPDGNSVGRNPENGCKFYHCSEENEINNDKKAKEGEGCGRAMRCEDGLECKAIHSGTSASVCVKNNNIYQ